MASSSFGIGNSGFTVMLKRNGRSSELNVSQVNTENLRRVFQVDPEEAWLQDDFDGSAYFPNDEGSFEGLRQFQTLVVMGVAMTAPTPRYQQQSPVSSLGSLPSSSSSLSSSSTPLVPFRCVIGNKGQVSFKNRQSYPHLAGK
uniref:Uncharacterized protein n=1 Tax=Amphimedon queenslandica TaxID=400682 RepID=A0A1X7TJK2_AMPQE